MTNRHLSPARQRVSVTVGESVRIVRELQELTQSDLARMTGIPQSTISAIENDSINLVVSEPTCSLEPSAVIRLCWSFPDGIFTNRLPLKSSLFSPPDRCSQAPSLTLTRAATSERGRPV
jgi:DNA-binding XRE family transcriptional regulator